MRIIISPAKKMRVSPDSAFSMTRPVFLARAGEILRWLQTLSYAQAKKLWACGDKIAEENFSRCIERYLQSGDRFITCIFGEPAGGKIVQKGVYAKMARGDMVRFMAEKRIEDPEELKAYDRMHYHFSEERSSETEYVFIRRRK